MRSFMELEFPVSKIKFFSCCVGNCPKLKEWRNLFISAYRRRAWKENRKSEKLPIALQIPECQSEKRMKEKSGMLIRKAEKEKHSCSLIMMCASLAFFAFFSFDGTSMLCDTHRVGKQRENGENFMSFRLTNLRFRFMLRGVGETWKFAFLNFH